MGARRRIIQGIGANGFGQAVTLLTQLASVPILIRSWGFELYGEWITLSAIPAYLVMSDIGLSLVAGNSLALLAEKGDEAEMKNIYQSVWVMVSLLTSMVLVTVMLVVWFLKPGEFLGLALISDSTLNVTLLLLFAHVAMCMQTGVIQLPYRVMKKTPLAVAANNTIRLLEWLTATIVVLSGGGVIQTASAFLVIRVIGNILLWLNLKRNGSFLRLGAKHASLKTVRKLLRPSLASMCFPLGLSFTMQGFVLFVGGIVGSAGVAVFTVYRTFTRVPVQIATAINRAVWPELSYAIGANDVAKARALVMKMLQFGLILSFLSGVSIYYLGTRTIDLWVGRELVHDAFLLLGLTLAALVHILWQSFWVALMATNKHSQFAGYFLAISASSLLACWACLMSFGLPGAGYAALLSECMMLIAAFASYNQHYRLFAND